MSASDSLVGKTFGKYVVQGELGRGGMGIVYKAQDSQLNRTVALKTLPAFFSDDPAFAERFKREAQATALLNHPNIVQVYEADFVGRTSYMALEYVRGGDVSQLISKRGSVPTREALDMARQVGEALRHAHSHGIVHRDIKPHNLLVTADGTVKVADFGLARAMRTWTSMTGPGALLGSPAYMSPEQVNGAHVDHRTDIYSMGITLYEMLAGRPPFDQGHPLALMHEIEQGRLASLGTVLPEVPVAVERLVSKMTARSPRRRYQDAEQAVEAIDEVLQLPLKESSSPTRVRSRRRRRRGVALLAVLLVVVLSTVLYAFIRSRGGEDTATVAATGAPGTVPRAIGPSTTSGDEEVTPAVTEAAPREIGPLGTPGEERTFLDMTFVWIEPGTFTMGSPENEPGWDEDETRHEVTISNGFWMAKYEMTQTDWAKWTEKPIEENPSEKKGFRLPVTNLSAADCRRLLSPLNSRHQGRYRRGDPRRGKGTFRLPTEAEWEYACRAGSTTAFCFGESISSVQARFNSALTNADAGDSPVQPAPVGSYPANAWGLHDMHGNVWEWCEDRYGPYQSQAVSDPIGHVGAQEVLRGGAWNSSSESCRSASRRSEDVYYSDGAMGIRLVLEPDEG